jgi:hypothetical protein
MGHYSLDSRKEITLLAKFAEEPSSVDLRPTLSTLTKTEDLSCKQKDKSSTLIKSQSSSKTNSRVTDDPQSFSKTCSPRLADRDGEPQHSSNTKLTRTHTWRAT